MSLPDRTKWTKGLIAKISVITGWVVPFDQVLNILIDQLEKKLFESYPTVNPDEVEFAFRERGTLLKDWGKEMNLALIDEVMVPYVEKRFEVSRKEEQLKNKIMLPESKEDMSDEGMDKLFDDTELLVKKGAYSIELIPPMLYDWMDKNGNILLNKDDKMRYIERATLYRHGMIATSYEHNPNSIEAKNNLVEFNKMRASKIYSEVEHNRIKELAKKMVLFDLMKQKVKSEI